jgi:hypothetical protein
VATADEYAAWIVKNADKKGTPEFETVAAAYKEAKDEPPAAVTAGQTIMGLPRQLGLTARYGMEGLGEMAQIGTEPLRQFITDPLMRAMGGQPGKPLGQAATGLADSLGLPKPQGANERVVGDASRLVAGVGGLGGASSLANKLPSMVGKGAEFLSANIGTQAASVAGAGGAGGAVREAGGGPWEQAGAALAGGLAVPGAAGGLSNLFSSVKNAVVAKLTPTATMEAVERKITLVMKEAGVDWGSLPERLRQSMRTEVASALKTGGDLNPDAARRLLDFKRTNTTPTRGMLTQDPAQITREQNLAKVGANSTDVGLQSLPRLQNQNAAGLLSNLDDLGAKGAPDAFRTGEILLGALNRNAGASKGRIDSLYKAARDTEGRSAQLDGFAFTQRASQLLDEGLLGGALPKGVEAHLNRIAKGEVPFTVDYAEQLKTMIGKLQRATSGRRGWLSARCGKHSTAPR